MRPDMTRDEPASLDGKGAHAGPEAVSGTPRPSRKDRERERHRQEVIEAAARLLERKSYLEIGVQEIAENAEFSVGYLYKLFASKEEIFESLLRQLHRQLERILDEQVSKPGSASDRLRSLVYEIFAWMNENPAYTWCTPRELMMISNLLPGLVVEFAMWEARFQARVRALFEDGIREGVFRDEDPRVMDRTLKALMKGFVFDDLTCGRVQEDWTEYAPIILRIFMRAFAPEGGQR